MCTQHKNKGNSSSVSYAIRMQATHLVGSAIRKCAVTDGESLCHGEYLRSPEHMLHKAVSSFTQMRMTQKLRVRNISGTAGTQT